ncbi:hypothetical protein EZV62_026158 [Acer yangbiense]|uniref:Uncharacterized protein n=1 Tax=Acer yangbiense TaxID=1000413 RepID=A0A5C7GPY9_9ROSI|nr:hypothetical protein EZV62_026158 [Acer yangbiense]
MHEAAICRNLEAVRLLVAENNELLRLENADGETPLFRAAAYGNTEIVKFLAYQGSQIVTNFQKKKQLNDNHCRRNDDTSILHIAIAGKHFGTALELLKLDPELANLEDKDGSDLYYLLDKMSSSLKSLPIGCGNNDEEDNIQILPEMCCWLPQWTSFQTRRLEALVSCFRSVCFHAFAMFVFRLSLKVSHLIYVSIWRFIIAVVKRIWKEKRGYKLASKLADELALELVDHRKQNILHVAAMYRQKEIFNFVKGKEIQKNRLARQIDINDYTILHCVADMEYYEGGTGPPYHLLREELEWFDSVKEITPTYYTMLEAKNQMTAWDFFKITHENQRQEAQKCIKNTCQLCITIAILVFFFVLAAAAFTPQPAFLPVFHRPGYYLLILFLDCRCYVPLFASHIASQVEIFPCLDPKTTESRLCLAFCVGGNNHARVCIDSLPLHHPSSFGRPTTVVEDESRMHHCIPPFELVVIDILPVVRVVYTGFEEHFQPHYSLRFTTSLSQVSWELNWSVLQEDKKVEIDP